MNKKDDAQASGGREQSTAPPDVNERDNMMDENACAAAAAEKGFGPEGTHRCDQSGATGQQNLNAADRKWIEEQTKHSRGKSKKEGGGGYDYPEDKAGTENEF